MNLIESKELVKFYISIGLSEKARILSDYIIYKIIYKE